MACRTGTTITIGNGNRISARLRYGDALGGGSRAPEVGCQSGGRAPLRAAALANGGITGDLARRKRIGGYRLAATAGTAVGVGNSNRIGASG